jgi:hypothetical protein
MHKILERLYHCRLFIGLTEEDDQLRPSVDSTGHKATLSPLTGICIHSSEGGKGFVRGGDQSYVHACPVEIYAV